jgi:hypothetical protein
MLTINEQMRSSDDLVEVMWRAFSYFPEGVWEGVNYVGNVMVKQDLKIKSGNDLFGAFLFSRLLREIRDMRSVYSVKELLLGVTHDPVIVVYYRLEGDGFKRVVNLVHDYVASDAGIISLYETEEDVAVKVTAHGLGHNQGLKHHLEPVDFMYEGLLHGKPVRIDGFCDVCQQELDKRAK